MWLSGELLNRSKGEGCLLSDSIGARQLSLGEGVVEAGNPGTRGGSGSLDHLPFTGTLLKIPRQGVGGFVYAVVSKLNLLRGVVRDGHQPTNRRASQRFLLGEANTQIPKQGFFPCRLAGLTILGQI